MTDLPMKPFQVIRTPLRIEVARAVLTAYGWSYLDGLLAAAGFEHGTFWCRPADRHGVRVVIFHVPSSWPPDQQPDAGAGW